MIDMDEYVRDTRANKEDCGWIDLSPELILTVGIDGVRGRVVMLIATDRDTMYRFVVNAIVQLRPVEVALVCDVHMRSFGHVTAEEAEAIEAEADAVAGTGANQAAFEAGDPNVTEAMAITVYDGLNLQTALLPYNAEHQTWLPAPHYDESRGATAELLTAAWREGFLAHAEAMFKGEQP
jgi:hypothetical protein